MPANYYEILGLDRNATYEAIRRAYRKLALALHPDRNNTPDAKERFKQINEAYKVLKDPSSRSDYDRCIECREQGERRKQWAQAEGRQREEAERRQRRAEERKQREERVRRTEEERRRRQAEERLREKAERVESSPVSVPRAPRPARKRRLAGTIAVVSLSALAVLLTSVLGIAFLFQSTVSTPESSDTTVII